MSRTQFDKQLRRRALPHIEKAFKELDTNGTNVHGMSLNIFEQCVQTVAGVWDMAWLAGLPKNVSREEYAHHLRERAKLHVKYLCRCDDDLAAEIVQDVISRI